MIVQKNIFIDLKEELNKARHGHYALGAFNTNNLEVTKAICKAASLNNAPIIIQTTPSALEYAGINQLFSIVVNEIKNSGIKAALHLDHAKSFSDIVSAVRVGFPSVMFDGSSLPYDENIALTSKVVKFAHSYGVAVEGEVGVIAREEGGELSNKSKFSAPKEVLEFVHLTGVDSVAVSVGNEHGAPADEKLNLDLLSQISELVDVPLVMHGSSGLSAGDIKEAIGCKVAKFNIDTNIKRVFAQTIESSKEDDYRLVMKQAMAEVEKVVDYYIKLFRGDK